MFVLPDLLRKFFNFYTFSQVEKIELTSVSILFHKPVLTPRTMMMQTKEAAPPFVLLTFPEKFQHSPVRGF